MTEREMVLKGLRCLSNPFDEERDCDNCSYDFCSCVLDVTADALELLKEQEPRVLALSEINKNSFVWYENKTYSKLFPALVAYCQSITLHYFIVEDILFDVGTYMPENVHYGKSWRCWNYKPTDEQRKAVKWDA